MPLFYSHSIDPHTRLAVWHITEPASFFLEKVPAGRPIAHPHKLLQHLAGRYLLQHLSPDLPLALIQVADSRKPFLADESHHFSISHAGHFAAAIVSRHSRVGIDVEVPHEKVKRLLPKFASPHELALLAAASQAHPALPWATILWSAKEAMFKWYSLGEIDFKAHLQVVNWQLTAADAGNIEALFCKGPAQAMRLAFKQWPGLVLSFTVPAAVSPSGA